MIWFAFTPVINPFDLEFRDNCLYALDFIVLYRYGLFIWRSILGFFMIKCLLITKSSQFSVCHFYLCLFLTLTQAGHETSRKMRHGDDNGDDKGEEGSSTPKCQRLDPDGILHSTPVRRSSSELFDPGCTPVSAGQRAEGSAVGSEQPGTEFLTPKCPPLRRLSTNTQSALRRAVLSTETRVGTGA